MGQVWHWRPMFASSCLVLSTYCLSSSSWSHVFKSFGGLVLVFVWPSSRFVRGRRQEGWAAVAFGRLPMWQEAGGAGRRGAGRRGRRQEGWAAAAPGEAAAVGLEPQDGRGRGVSPGPASTASQPQPVSPSQPHSAPAIPNPTSPTAQPPQPPRRKAASSTRSTSSRSAVTWPSPTTTPTMLRSAPTTPTC